MSLVILYHTLAVLSATQHKWTHPSLTPDSQAGTRFTYPGGMEVLCLQSTVWPKVTKCIKIETNGLELTDAAT